MQVCGLWVRERETKYVLQRFRFTPEVSGMRDHQRKAIKNLYKKFSLYLSTPTILLQTDNILSGAYIPFLDIMFLRVSTVMFMHTTM